MLFNNALIFTFLLASAVLADRRHEHRRSRLGHPIRRTSDDRVSYIPDGAGANLIEKNGTVTFATGTFTVPKGQGNSGALAIPMVDIDIGPCGQGVGAAVVIQITDKGPIYQAAAIFAQGDPYIFPDSEITISGGDVVILSVNAKSATSGYVTIENTKTGATVSHDFEFPDMCWTSAGWFVAEGEKNSLDFATAAFANAQASGPSGPYALAQATVFDMKQNDHVLATTSVDKDSVIIKYVGK